ncbi:MAG: sulfite exporter TauE/SafE family protein, partial [Campylobacteraceae bacterium]|nr:sulfite exporter TauE/SafE family protein [Campylobacteraceae bacterium]
NQVIVTVAALSTITHTLKIFVFIALGFAFFDYLELMIFMIVGSIVGSYLGTLVRKKINTKKLVLFIKILLSILAVKSIFQVFI